MQPFQREQQQQQQSNVRLTRQLPAETSKEKAPPFPFTHQKKFAKSAPTRFNPFTRDQQHTHQQLLRAQTDLREFDTHRSLSSCPTYSSLSRHSPETRVRVLVLSNSRWIQFGIYDREKFFLKEKIDSTFDTFSLFRGIDCVFLFDD